MRSIGLNPLVNSSDLNTSNTTNTSTATYVLADQNVQNENLQQQQQPAQNNLNIDANELRNEEREDDWLSLLHNFCSFLVLFSIVYFYSSFTRFLIVFFAVLLLML